MTSKPNLERILDCLQELAQVTTDIHVFTDSRYTELFQQHGIAVPRDSAAEVERWDEVAAGITHLAEELQTAVARGDNDLLFTLGLTASSRNTEEISEPDAGWAEQATTEYEVYVWYSTKDGWCFVIPELEIVQRSHYQPGAVATYARHAVEAATDEPANIRIYELPTPPSVSTAKETEK